jgi:hypothetical protein
MKAQDESKVKVTKVKKPLKKIKKKKLHFSCDPKEIDPLDERFYK